MWPGAGGPHVPLCRLLLGGFCPVAAMGKGRHSWVSPQMSSTDAAQSQVCSRGEGLASEGLGGGTHRVSEGEDPRDAAVGCSPQHLTHWRVTGHPPGFVGRRLGGALGPASSFSACVPPRKQGPREGRALQVPAGLGGSSSSRQMAQQLRRAGRGVGRAVLCAPLPGGVNEAGLLWGREGLTR